MKYKRIVYVFLLFSIMLGMTGCIFVKEKKSIEVPKSEMFFLHETVDECIDTNDLYLLEPIEKNISTEVFFEDFDGYEIDETCWNRLDREENYNDELQVYVSENAFVQDGNLVLLAENKDGKYISGLVDTKSKLEFRYGTVEVRLKYPEGKSFFPAVWLLPIDDTSFPEIDILEVVGHEPYKIYSVYHYYKNEKQKIFSVTSIENNLDYHTCKFEWTPNEMIWYVDEDEVLRIENEVPDEPMYLIINFAIGGIWPGDPDENTVFPSSVMVDYIRIVPYEEIEELK